MSPLAAEAPEFDVDNNILPENDVELSPERRLISPPVELRLSPAEILMLPPRPVDDVPIFIATLPL